MRAAPYFTEPKQLVDILTALEDKNLLAIQLEAESDQVLAGLTSELEETERTAGMRKEELREQKRNLEKTAQMEQKACRALSAALVDKSGADKVDAELQHVEKKVLKLYSCIIGESHFAEISHMLEGVEARIEEIGGELDELGEQDGELINNLEGQMEKTRRDRMRVQKAEDHKQKVEQRLMAAYQRMESSSKGRGTAKPIRFRSSPQDATKNKKQAAEDARKRREQEYSELLGVDAAQIGARRRSSGRILH
ncbi:hypothetical protein FOZ62_016848 [Perkinsus olseni]|uniref:Uncharacterized protein n=1 Tax=Perkinsus olseni TaxID=32597 RepID=A0A7J6QD32_PEROL|nr:hypothetical protein FOZ62_016848 [Perkinsus olseni]